MLPTIQRGARDGADGSGAAARCLTLSVVEYQVLWSELGLGRMSYPLHLPRPDLTPGQWHRRRAQVWQALGERGLAIGTTLDDELVRRLTLLAWRQLGVNAEGYRTDTVRALLVADGSDTVLALLTRDFLSLYALGEPDSADAG